MLQIWKIILLNSIPWEKNDSKKKKKIVFFNFLNFGDCVTKFSSDISISSRNKNILFISAIFSMRCDFPSYLMAIVRTGYRHLCDSINIHFEHHSTTWKICICETKRRSGNTYVQLRTRNARIDMLLQMARTICSFRMRFPVHIWQFLYFCYMFLSASPPLPSLCPRPTCTQSLSLFQFECRQ